MLLTSSTAVSWLLARNYLTREELIRGNIEVSEITTRNRGFRVVLTQDRGYWVKQLRDWNPSGVLSFRQEARWYWLVRNEPAFASFRSSVPHCLSYDKASEILVLELGGSASKDLRNHPGRFLPNLASLLGRTLARVHRIRQTDSPAGFPANGAPPWVFSLASDRQGFARPRHDGIVKVLRQYPDYRTFLEALQREWSPTNLIHADMKFDNCIAAVPGEASAGDPGLRIIDWELANWGDPCWDVAGIVQSYWSDWIRERAPIETVRDALGHFFAGWRDAFAASTNSSAGELLSRTMRLAAARLIQRSWEEGHLSWPLPDHIVKMLQLSLNVFADPARAGRELVGL